MNMKLCTFISYFLVTATLVIAGDIPSKDHYETATVSERSLASATASVIVLDRDAIGETGARSVNELLRFIPGLDVTTDGARGGLATARIRGGDPNFTLILIDGVPVNDLGYQVGDVFNLNAVPLFNIERVEVVKGPLSSFYGSTGLAGVINLITTQQGSGGTDVALEFGDEDQIRASGRYTTRNGPLSLGLSVNYEEEKERIAAERMELYHFGAFLERSFPNADLRINTRFASWEGDDYPDASGGPIFGSGELRYSENTETGLGALLSFGQSEHRHRLSLSYYRHDLDRTSPAVFPMVPASTEETAFTKTRLAWHKTLFDNQRFLIDAGADISREQGDNQSILALPPFLGGDVPGNYDLERTLAGAFSEIRLQQGNWTGELALRYDQPEGSSGQWSPRAGFAWTGNATRVHGSAGRAFKLPGFFALASPRQLGGNEDLESETSWGSDLGFEHRFQDQNLEMGVTLFYNRFEELIDFDFDSFLHINRGEVISQGFEFYLTWKPSDRLSLALDATHQDVEDQNSAAPLRNRPDWLYGGHVSWKATSRLQLRLNTRAHGESHDQQIPVQDRFTVGAYSLTNFTANWSLSEDWQIKVFAENLFDKNYETMIGFPGPGRSFGLGLNLRTQ